MGDGIVEGKGLQDLAGEAQGLSPSVPPSAPRWRSRLGFQDTPGTPAHLWWTGYRFYATIYFKERKRLKKKKKIPLFCFCFCLQKESTASEPAVHFCSYISLMCWHNPVCVGGRGGRCWWGPWQGETFTAKNKVKWPHHREPPSWPFHQSCHGL